MITHPNPANLKCPTLQMTKQYPQNGPDTPSFVFDKLIHIKQCRQAWKSCRIEEIANDYDMDYSAVNDYADGLNFY